MLGIYDTGLGGLAITKEILKLMPDLDLIYLADQNSLPVGQKTGDQIKTIAQNAVNTLFGLGCDLVLLACNSATVNSICHLQQVWLVAQNLQQTHSILGVSEPLLEILDAQKPDLSHKNGLLLATAATYGSGFYQSKIKQRGYFKLKTIACPGLAQAVETQNSNIIKQALREIFDSQKLDLKQIEYLVLACTHYSWIETELHEFFDDKIKIINPAQAVAQKLELYFTRHTKYFSENKYQKFLINNIENLEKYSNFIQTELGLEQKFILLQPDQRPFLVATADKSHK